MRLLLTLLLLAVAAAPATAGFHLPGDAVEDKRVLLAEPVVIEPTTTAAPTTTTTRVVEWRPRPSWNPVFELTADRHRRLLKITIPEPLLFLRNPVGDYYFHGGYGFYGRSYIDEDGTRIRGCVSIAGSCWQNWPGGEMKRVNAYSFEAEIACDLPWNVIAPSLTMTNQKSQWTDSNPWLWKAQDWITYYPLPSWATYTNTPVRHETWLPPCDGTTFITDRNGQVVPNEDKTSG